MLHCLLCMRPNSKQIKLSTKKARDLKCATIIAKHFWLKPKDAGNSRESVCFCCWDTLLAFHQLYETVAKAHNYFECEVLNNSIELVSEEKPESCNFGLTKIEALERQDFERDVQRCKENSETVLEVEENIKTEVEFHETPAIISADDEDWESELPLSMLRSNIQTIEKEHENDLTHNDESALSQMKAQQNTSGKKSDNENRENIENFSENEFADPNIDSDFHTDGDSEYAPTDEDIPLENRKTKKPTENYNENIAKYFENLECLKCKMLFQTFDDLSHHCQTAHNKPPAVICCGRTFRKANTLSCHVLLHLSRDHVKCSHCTKVFESIELLDQHVESDHRCNKCSEIFSNKKELRRHQMDAHSLIPSTEFECVECDKKFSTRRKHYEHKRGVHGAKVSCDLCGKQLKCRWSLYKHMLSHKRFACNECSECFSSKPNLQLHQLNAHGLKPNTEFECPECGKKFSTKRKLYEHKRSVHAAKYVCDMCGKHLDSRISFYWHMRKHRDEPAAPQDPVECDICGKWIKYRNNLKQHKEWVHGKRFEFKCPICNKLSASQHALHGHIKRMHNNERSFPCTMCERVFKSNFDLKEHVNTHTKEIQFPCEICTKVFFRKATLQRHVKKVHCVERSLPSIKNQAIKAELSLQDLDMQL